jgi:predicted RNA-binding Zn-ribbon protein involved in translation (DUF1610 family)
MSDRTTTAEPSKRYRRAAKRYPELLLFPNDETRSTAMRRAEISPMRSPFFWIVSFALGSLMIVATLLILKEIRFVEWPLPPYIRTIPIGALVGGVVTYVVVRSTRHLVRRSLRLQLQEMSIPVCLHCGYDLRGQVDPRCPECGQPFDPALLNRHAARKLPSGT